MYQQNPFNRPNPFRGLHSYSTSSSYSFQPSLSSSTPSFPTRNQDRLQQLLRMNPFYIPYKHEPILNNGIQQYTSGFSPVLSQRKFQPELPTVSWNYFTRIGGGVINPTDYQQYSAREDYWKEDRRYGGGYEYGVEEEKIYEREDESGDNKRQNEQSMRNQGKVDTLFENKEKEKIEFVKDNRLSKKDSKQYSRQGSQSSKQQNILPPPSPQIDYITAVNHYGINKTKPTSSTSNLLPTSINNQILTNNNSNFLQSLKQQQRPISNIPLSNLRPSSPSHQDISLNDFPQAKQTVNKQIISITNQPNQNQLLDYNTKYSNQSAPVSKVSGIVYRPQSKQSNDLNQLVYPFESLSKIPSHEEISEQPSQILVEGNKYYRISFRENKI